jgi:predicted AlkP superfamily phosphohydrolase/phosphomutase
VGFCEPHPAGHYLWPADVGCVSSAQEDQVTSLLSFYVALDRALGALVDKLPVRTTLLIVSGDGVCVNYSAWYLLPAVLERLGYTHPAGSETGNGHQPRSLVGRAKRMVSPAVRRRIADLLPWWLRDKLGAREQAADLEGCIRINLKGREPNGIVEPGAEYSRLCDEIRARLLEFTNPANGMPAVRRVWIRNEVFPGDRQEQLPDLIVTWNHEAPFKSLASPRFGRVEAESADPRPGTHSPEGFLLALGPGIPTGDHATGRLVDVAPTILQLLGITLPTHLDGEPLSLAVN